MAEEDKPKKDETTRLGRPGKLTLKKDGSTEISEGIPSAGDTQEVSGIIDPTRKRDTNTASLKRLRPENLETNTEEKGSTDTVNIKVIKEQKKQFRNLMSSSQTLRVRPDQAQPGSEPSASAQTVQSSPAPTEEQTKTAEVKKRTLKLKAPVQTRTEAISRPEIGGTSGTIVSESSETQPSASPKATLKLKAPSAEATQDAPTPKASGATLKIKAPAPSDTSETEAAAAQTLKKPAESQAKTLKLRQKAPTESSSGKVERKSSSELTKQAAARAASDKSGASIDGGFVDLVLYAFSAAACAGAIFFSYQSVSSIF
ncbi:MAG: hypothetical protein MK193_07530 [Lentisphaeria bacterium]|nr:hypothetical protein [Lentisphaeria bacterium]